MAFSALPRNERRKAGCADVTGAADDIKNKLIKVKKSMKLKSKKSALLLSFTSLLLCFAMLAGSTFAWFTDTATTGVNKIVAGNLKVDIIGTNSEDHVETLNFTKAAGAQGEQLLWEPGCRYLTEGFRIANNGNLALKWKVEVNKGTTATNAKNADLLKVIDFYVVTESENGDQKATELAAFEGQLKDENSFSTDTYYIKGHMQEEAGNDYQGLMLDGITITVYATQLTSEFDSFNNTYDKDAEYPIDTWKGDIAADNELAAATDNTNKVVTVESGKLLAALVEAVNGGNSYEGYTIKLTKNIDLNGKEWTPIGTKGTSKVFKGIFDGDGRTIKNLKISSGDCVAFFGAVENATVKNLTVEGNVNGKNAAGIVARVVGGATIENCVNRATINASDKAAGIVMYAQGSSSYDQYGPLSNDCVIKNCKNYGAVNANKIAAGGIYGWSADESGKLKITDCENNGVVTATNTAQAGGIAGNCRVITVENCVNNGTVTSAANAGGIVGKNDTKASTITSCKNTATVMGAEYKTGGIAGTFIGEIKNSSTTGNDVLVGTLGTTTTNDVNTIKMATKTRIKISAFEGNISLKNVEIDVVNVFVGTGNREINLSNASVATLTLTGGKDADGNYMGNNRTVLTRDDEASTIGAIVVNGQCKDATSFMYIYLNGICNNVVNHMTTADGTKGANICTFETGTINNGIVAPLEGEKTRVEYTA